MNSSWEYTRLSYTKWLANNDLKKLFLKNFKYKDFSLWWATKLVDKDNINHNNWYYDLNSLLTKKNIKNKKFSVFYFIYKFFKKLFKSILFNILIKILISQKKKNKIIDNCFYSFEGDLIEKSNYFIDRQYGNISLSEKKNISYIINLNENINIIKNIFQFKKKLKKIPCDYYFLDHYISVREIIKIHFFTLWKFLNLIFEINKKKFFNINNIDCSFPLKDQLIESFLGDIQSSLISGISIGRFIKKRNCKNLISYLEFYPIARSTYYFSKLFKKNINLIGVNHANYSRENLFFNLTKNEFNLKKIHSMSPHPDIFLCQGKKYSNVLKNIFSKKRIFTIGSLKLEMETLRKNKKLTQKIKKKLKLKSIKKRILLILPSLNDYLPFIKILNEIDLSDYQVVLKSHPVVKSETINYFKKEFIHNFLTIDDMNTRDLIHVSDRIIFGDSSIGLEAAIKNKNVFRIYHKNYLPTFTPDDEIPTACNTNQASKFLKKKKIIQKSKIIEKMYFFKYDQNASKRLFKVLKSF